MTRSRRTRSGCIVVLTTSYPRSPDDAAGHFVAAEVDRLVAQGKPVAVIHPSRRRSVALGNPLRVGVGCGGLFNWPGAWPRLRRAPWRVVWAALFIVRARVALHRLPRQRVIAHWLVPSAWPTCLGLSSLEVVVHGSDAALLGRLPPAVQSAVLLPLRARRARLRFVAEHLKQRLRAPGHQRWIDDSVVAPSPIDVPELEPREALRSALGIDEGTFLVVLVSRLVAAKRVDVALRRAPLPRGARVVVLGDGPERTTLQRRFPQVRFLGHCPRLQALRWMGAADAVLSASLEEGAPTVIREARALGTVVWCAPSTITTEWTRDDPGIILCQELAERSPSRAQS